MTWLALAVATTLNLVAAVPALPGLEALLPVGGPVGVIGSLAISAITAWVVALLLRGPAPRPAITPADAPA